MCQRSKKRLKLNKHQGKHGEPAGEKVFHRLFFIVEGGCFISINRNIDGRWVCN